MSNQPLVVDTEFPQSSRLGENAAHHDDFSQSIPSSILPHMDSVNDPIASPPAIRKERSLSTAATTVISNKKRFSPLREVSFGLDAVLHQEQLACDVHYSGSLVHHNNFQNHPPSEIRIPKASMRKRRCLNTRENDDDEHSTTSSQDLSNDGDGEFDSHNDMSDYKTLYFNCQRENYALRGQVLGMQEANRKLKRQLIEMQKQIFAYSRNKRRSDSSCKASVSPWSIPVGSYLQQERKAAVVRVPREATSHAKITPPSQYHKPTSGASKSVSMSVSSEEGNTSRS